MRAKAIICDGDKYLVAEIGMGQYSGFWEFIGGHVPEDKTPEQYLKDFTEEFFGLKIIVGEILTRYETTFPAWNIDFYLCELVEGEVNFNGLFYRITEWVKKEDLKSVRFESANFVAVDAILNQ